MVSINTIDIGLAPDDGNGDPLRTAFNKSNVNDTSLNVGIASLDVRAGSIEVAASSLSVRAGSIEVAASSLSVRVGSLDTRVGSVSDKAGIEAVIVALSDETTDVTAGTAKSTFRAPFAMTITDVRASATTAPTGSKAGFDVNVAGSSIFSFNLNIDDGERTSTTAESSFILSSTAIADDDEIVIDVDSVGATTAGRGFKVSIIGERS